MENKPYRITLNTIEVDLLPEKAIYFPKYRTLVLADWHLGKTTHFRKHGIFIPQTSVEKEFNELQKLLSRYPTEKLILLGDLFHSDWNEDWEFFKELVEDLSDVEIILTRGNHDIMDFEKHGVGGINLVDSYMIEDKFLFTHHSSKNTNHSYINIVGHTHPGYLLRMKGKQKFRLPCFYFSKNKFIVPAFGQLTGLYTLKKTIESEVYIVAGNEIFKI
jgi:DNA ligase-associated metallophosphoesterase